MDEVKALGFNEILGTAFTVATREIGLALRGIEFLINFSLVGCVMVFENVFGIQALSRSSDLIHGSRWRAHGLFAVAFGVRIVLIRAAHFAFLETPEVE